MHLKGYIFLTGCSLLLSVQGAGATMYACKTSNGSVQFTNAPTLSSCKEINIEDRTVRITKTYSPHVVSDPARYERHIISASYRYDIDPHLIRAVIRAESDFNRYAVSKKGARGLMQLMPETARELNVSDSFDPAQNIHGGTRYLRKLLDMFKGDLALALAAYNAGPTAVKKVNRIPMITETRNYVKKVMKYYKSYRQDITAGSSGNTVRNEDLEIARVE